ncbi:MAG: M23 family metallopeptidase [Salana multivorans]|nr:M23 family metallopeptidase [Salana multivorans]
MLKKLALAALAMVLLGPATILMAIALLVNPAGNAGCTVLGSGLTVGSVPDSLRVTAKDGTAFTLNKQQLTHAATIITVGSQIEGVTRDGIQIALMAALTESTLRMLSNTGVYPESADYPNDGDASDHDSLGLFQMRPQSGWGTVTELMDPTYQAQAFFGGPTGPNYPSPRGLLDIPGWQTMSKGEAAQAVEVSAFPDRYANYEPVADTILDALTKPTPGSGGQSNGAIPETSRIVFPLPEGTWVMTSPVGPRIHPITGASTVHSGTDYAAPDGTPIYAVADGIVATSEYTDSGGGHVVIDHTVGGQASSTDYRHMWQSGIHVTVGDRVTAGQHIGDVGNSGQSTGAHLHIEVRPTGGDSIDADAWLADHKATTQNGSTSAGVSSDGCATNRYSGQATAITGDGGQMVDDPTTGGQITSRMAQVMAQTKAAFPDTSWSCYSPRPGQNSEHPKGRACDITFGNAIGSRPTPSQLDAGWQVTNWVKDNADILGVEYLIWQGQIWSLARNDDGWRPYNGGGMHDPASITGGHFDHLHITVKVN